MAITQRELQISNKSYTNKDFEAVYLELVDYAEKLSKRFSPAHSNESDPFVVLLKLVAFATDKVNYNLDKNILEAFMTSCTQEKSMRELCEMLGYPMHYYEAASTNVIFKYKFTGSESNFIRVPKFSAVSDGVSAQYVTIEDAYINKETGVSEATPVLQGKRKVFTVLGSDIIQLENIENNKLYFPELYAAQNGVFVETYIAGQEATYTWECVENLNVQEYGSKVFKFGFDTMINRPYLEFPDWLNEIIGSGLRIDYIVTDGVAGNVGVKELTTVNRLNISDDIKDDEIIVINNSAANNGKDIETINEAYEGFKKTIGTFETLVTCRDYANYIYTHLDDLVSNVQVADRRTDINYGINVLQHTEYGVATLSETANLPISKKISANDLLIYPLKPLTNTDYTGLKSVQNSKDIFVEGGYDDGYRHVTNTSTITSKIENAKSISHDYKDWAVHDYGVSGNHGDLICIKDNYELNAVISTSYKVNVLEQLDIKYNIKNALIQNFNSRTMDWGEEIPFEQLVNTIMKADSRITNVSLMQPEHSLEFVEFADNGTGNDNELRITKENNSEKYNFWIDYIITKNILEGRVSLYDYDTDFSYDFTEANSGKKNSVKSFTSKCKFDAIPVSSGSSATTTTLKNNQVIQFIAPSLVVGNGVYPYMTHYVLGLATGDKISKDADYNLGTGEYIALLYTQDDKATVELYDGTTGRYIITTGNGEIPVASANNIISPNFDLHTTEYLSDPSHYGITMDESALHSYENAWNYAWSQIGLSAPALQAATLQTNEEITHKIFNEETITTTKKCYWFTNETDNRISWDKTVEGKWTYLLKENEYFFYSDNVMSSLYSYGSGTLLTLVGSTAELNQLGDWLNKEAKSVDEITENGLDSLRAVFKTKAFKEAAKLNIKLNEIITLTAGDKIKITNNGSAAYTITDNNFSAVTGLDIQYQFSSADSAAFVNLPDRSSLGEDYRWKMRSLLDINCGPDLAQKIEDKEEIMFLLSDDTSFKLVAIDSTEAGTPCDYFKLSVNTQVGGGENVSLRYYDIDLSEQYPNLYYYKYEAITSVIAGTTTEADVNIVDTDDGYTYTIVDGDSKTINTTFNIPNIASDPIKGVYISVYRRDIANCSSSATLTFSVNTGTITPGSVTLDDGKSVLFKINGATQLIISTYNATNLSLRIDKPSSVVSNNKFLKSDASAVADYDFNAAATKYYGATILNKFYATCELDNSKVIQLSSRCHLDDPVAFLDYNNVANPWLIGKIDFEKSVFEIAANCKLNK